MFGDWFNTKEVDAMADERYAEQASIHAGVELKYAPYRASIALNGNGFAFGHFGNGYGACVRFSGARS